MKPFNVYLAEVKGMPRAMVAKPASHKDVDFAVDHLSEAEKEMFMQLLFNDYLRMARDHAMRDEMLREAEVSAVPTEPAARTDAQTDAQTDAPKPKGKRGGKVVKIPQSMLDSIRAYIMRYGEISTPMIFKGDSAWTSYSVHKVLGQLVSEGLYTKEKRGKGKEETCWYIRVEEPAPSPAPVPVQTVESVSKREMNVEFIMAHKKVMLGLFKEAWTRKLRGEYLGLHDAKDIAMAVLKEDIEGFCEIYETGSMCRLMREVMTWCCNNRYDGFGPLLRHHREVGQLDGNMFEARNSTMKIFAKNRGWKY